MKKSNFYYFLLRLFPSIPNAEVAITPNNPITPSTPVFGRVLLPSSVLGFYDTELSLLLSEVLLGRFTLALLEEATFLSFLVKMK